MAPLWTPSSERIAQANMTRLLGLARERYRVDATEYERLHDWSVCRPLEFWDVMWDFGGVRGSKGARVAIEMDRMPGATFFPDATLNFAENVLARDDGTPAIIHRTETTTLRSMSWRDLRAEAGAFAAALRSAGIRPGDRVAAYLPNVPEAIAGVLGAAAVGAVWSSCSPDFGVEGVVDRFGQIEPRVLIAADKYSYGGKTFDQRAKIAGIMTKLPTVE